MSDSPPPAADPTSATDPFSPAARRRRHDGWTPDRQHDFIRALAECACVTEACAAVGLSPSSAYRLRALPAASAFRQAWDVALDYAVRRLGDAAMSRALHGVSRPVFYKGEQIGERRYFDERLTQFVLRYRDPVRYGRWLDGYEARRHPDGAGITLAYALNAVTDAGHGVGALAGDWGAPLVAPANGQADCEPAADGAEPPELPASPKPGRVRMPPAVDQGPPEGGQKGESAARSPAEEAFIASFPQPLRDLKEALRQRVETVEQNRCAQFADEVAVDVSGDWSAPLTIHRPRRQARPRPRPESDFPT